ncbi:CHASE2 domain-containing protein [uncultured Enterovirga sp.]|uniref:CHASE2 domain-containing protein n=1 Tax=uncultured Enterovirga sp. TaxID=2026352 RepID=UPI0035CAFB84
MDGPSPGSEGPSRRREKARWVALLGLAPALVCAAIALYEPFAARAVRDVVFDSYQRLVPRVYDPAIPVRVIAIDNESLARIGQWPWPRAKIAELLDKLTAASPATIAVDILFSEPERSGDANGLAAGDDELRAALARGRVVLGSVLVKEGGSPPESKIGVASMGDDARLFAPRFLGALQPLDRIREAAKGVGAMNVEPDRDLVVREIPTVFAAGGILVPSLDVAALLVAQDASTIVVRSSNGSTTVGDVSFGAKSGITHVAIGAVRTATGRDGAVRIHFAGSQPGRTIPAWQVLAGGFERASVENAIVIIGITAAGFDIRATPLSPVVPGVEIRAEMVESLLAGRHLVRPDYMPAFEALMVLVGSLFAVAAASRLSPAGAAAVTVALVLLFIGTSAVAFLRLQLLLNPVWPTLGTISALGLSTLAVLRQSEAERRQVREAFSRYVSPSIVERLADDPSGLVLGGENRILTVLFSDIRGFTSRSETLPAEEVLGFLNQVHAPMTELVLESGGTLDKFIGDGMMAFWNAPLDHPDHARAALRTALRMQSTVDEINRRLASDAPGATAAPEPLGLGIGLHTGPACVGNIGSVRRFDYSAIGDTVNTAARLEPMCKTYGIPIIVSSDVVAAVPDFAFLLVDIVTLKGKSHATRLYALHGDETAVTADFTAFRDAHDRAVEIALAGRPDARAALRACAENALGSRCRSLYGILEGRNAGAVELSAG